MRIALMSLMTLTTVMVVPVLRSNREICGAGNDASSANDPSAPSPRSSCRTGTTSRMTVPQDKGMSSYCGPSPRLEQKAPFPPLWPGWSSRS